MDFKFSMDSGMAFFFLEKEDANILHKLAKISMVAYM